MGAESQHSTYTIAGTYFYMPPEKMRPDKKKVSFYSDMWSFGITLLQVLTADLNAPYGPGVSLPNLIFSLLVDNKAPEVAPIPECPALHDLLAACLSLDGAARPSAADAVKTLESILHALTTPPLSPRSAALKAKDEELEELRKKLAAVELREEEERKRRAEAERKIREAEQREAQLREQSRAADAKRQAQTAGALPKHALKLLSSPAHTATLSGHKDTVNSVAFTPDGASLVSGSDDNTLKLWDVTSGCCTATLEGHSNRVYSVAVSVDGRTAASGSQDMSVKLWDLGNQRCRATLTGHTKWVKCVAFSPDGATGASGSGDYTIRLWDASTGKHKATLKGGDVVYGLAFSADGTRLA
ncbi:WD40-repeat-containing domain protein [Dunaliella salina]|uniref:WD40-repeat-containing domain protein n=1 Tax=Dunaliella salina TaxID=3046 RepID=A0ABQ7G9I7_DUNSA|nr:WD40-repeat-containing domain protein [Dunaliella salina]|eukprot:KAF5831268.1 WD40-repeat-containing domain protein [Dunaliella salina]